MTIATSPSATERDLRLDFFRGLALFCMLSTTCRTHPGGFYAPIDDVSDAAEVFIIDLRLHRRMVYGRAMERQGFLVAGVRVYHGCGSSTSPMSFCHDVYGDSGVHGRCPQ